jgi:hypothetical protein
MSDDKDNAMQHQKGRPMAVDSDVVGTSSDALAFITPPDGVPVYYGFPVLEDVVVDGFIFGKITDFDAEPCTEGDAFVIAPDNSRAGLVWEVGETVSISEVVPMDANRWGVWKVRFRVRWIAGRMRDGIWSRSFRH